MYPELGQPRYSWTQCPEPFYQSVLCMEWRPQLSNLHSLKGCQVSALCCWYSRCSSTQDKHRGSHQAWLSESDAQVFTPSHSSMFCRGLADNYHALCSEHRNNLCKYQIVQKKYKAPFETWEGVGRNCDWSRHSCTISGAIPISDFLTIQLESWTTSESPRRPSQSLERWWVTAVSADILHSWRVSEMACWWESLARVSQLLVGWWVTAVSAAHSAVLETLESVGDGSCSAAGRSVDRRVWRECGAGAAGQAPVGCWSLHS